MVSPVDAVLVGGDNPHAKGWLETLKHCEAVSDVLLCGEEVEISEGVRAVYGSPAELLAVEKPGLAIVCARNDQAPALAKALLAAGVPTLVEKPVARTAGEIAEIDAIARQNDVLWTTGFMNRYHPAALQMKAWVEEGAIGQVVSVEGRMVTSTVAQRNPQHWLFSHEKSGGGILHWLAIHTVDLVRYISGCDYASVCAQTATLVEDIDVEEVASATFSLDNGAIGHIHAGYVLPRRYGDIFLCLRGTRGDITWRMWGTEGRQDELVVQSEVGEWGREEYRQIHCPSAAAPGYGGQMGLDYLTDFIRAAEEKNDFVCKGEDALRAMQFVEAAYASAANGQRMEL
ncbi:MAG: Gfo/Idh/MocA family protein [Candidatus Latescibacterota bacterium]|jgi:predicted dehydrogenase